MARHHDRHLEVWRIGSELVDQGLGEAFHRKFCRTVDGVRYCPEAVYAARVDDVSLAACHQQRHERAAAVKRAESANA